VNLAVYGLRSVTASTAGENSLPSGSGARKHADIRNNIHIYHDFNKHFFADLQPKIWEIFLHNNPITREIVPIASETR
jgi:hypothetical protein